MVDRDALFDYTSAKLEVLERDRAKLKAQLTEYAVAIEEATDIDIKKSYQLRKDRLFNDVDRVEQEIRDAQGVLRQQSAQSEVRRLLEILKADESYLELIQQAYEAMASRWSGYVPAVSTKDGYKDYLVNLVSELQRLGDSRSGYSALESFVANLVHLSKDPELLAALNQWGSRTQSWNTLYTKIQTSVAERVKSFNPAILVKLNLAEQAQSQSNNQRHCRLEAWLIEDLETYQNEQTGYHSLVVAETAISKPFPLDEIEAHLQPLLKRWLEEKKRLLGSCKQDPEFYVFLPLELLPLAVDAWPLDDSDSPQRLGHSYPVILCCLDRFENDVYPIEDWHNSWTEHNACLARKAREVFIEGSHQDVGTFIDALDALEAEDTDKTIVGWKVNTSPCSTSLEECCEEYKEFFEELLFLGVPLAFWSRCNESGIDNAKELDKLLRVSPLGQLPKTIKTQRVRGRRRSPACCISHHLSLLRDNPSLKLPVQLPKRA